MADGRKTEIIALTECGTYVGFLKVAEGFLERVRQHEKMVEEMKSNNKPTKNVTRSR